MSVKPCLVAFVVRCLPLVSIYAPIKAGLKILWGKPRPSSSLGSGTMQVSATQKTRVRFPPPPPGQLWSVEAERPAGAASARSGVGPLRCGLVQHQAVPRPVGSGRNQQDEHRPGWREALDRSHLLFSFLGAFASSEHGRMVRRSQFEGGPPLEATNDSRCTVMLFPTSPRASYTSPFPARTPI